MELNRIPDIISLLVDSNGRRIPMEINEVYYSVGCNGQKLTLPIAGKVIKFDAERQEVWVVPDSVADDAKTLKAAIAFVRSRFSPDEPFCSPVCKKYDPQYIKIKHATGRSLIGKTVALRVRLVTWETENFSGLNLNAIV